MLYPWPLKGPCSLHTTALSSQAAEILWPGWTKKGRWQESGGVILRRTIYSMQSVRRSHGLESSLSRTVTCSTMYLHWLPATSIIIPWSPYQWVLALPAEINCTPLTSHHVCFWGNPDSKWCLWFSNVSPDKYKIKKLLPWDSHL